MESDKPALEQVALDMVELYGRDAPKMLLERAEIADEYGEHLSAKTWREIAALAARIARRVSYRC